MAVVGPHGCKTVGGAVRQVLILDTWRLVRSSWAIMDWGKQVFVQPSTPPFPVARYRAPFHSLGSHSSKLMLERLEVGIWRPTRQRSTSTFYAGRLQDGTLSLRDTVVP